MKIYRMLSWLLFSYKIALVFKTIDLFVSLLDDKNHSAFLRAELGRSQASVVLAETNLAKTL